MTAVASNRQVKKDRCQVMELMSEMDDKGNDSVTNNVVLLRMIIIIDCHH
jgi:hypothetical protein